MYFRVITCEDVKEIGGHTFQGFGAHINNYPCPYFTAAAAVGMTRNDVDLFIKRLDKTLSKTSNAISKESTDQPPSQKDSTETTSCQENMNEHLKNMEINQ